MTFPNPDILNNRAWILKQKGSHKCFPLHIPQELKLFVIPTLFEYFILHSTRSLSEDANILQREKGETNM